MKKNSGGSSFVFTDDSTTVFSEHDFSLKIPRNILSKQILLSLYAETASFPNYYGYNWDALLECLIDVSWIPQRRIVISHEDVPLSNDELQQRLYLEVLEHAAKDWKTGDQHELLIVFPCAAKAIVNRHLTPPQPLSNIQKECATHGEIGDGESETAI